MALEREGSPHEFTGHLGAERPGGLRSRAFTRQEVRRRDVVFDLRRFADLYDPWEFAQYESGSSVCRLKVLEPSALQLPDAVASRTGIGRGLLKDGDVRP